jgi:ubiquinone/menaquinone biosynthesis C-methylase UbiE
MSRDNDPSDDQYKTSANLHARANLHRFSTSPVAWFDWLFDHVLRAGLPSDGCIADVGGGPGAYWKHVERRVPTGWRIVHSDSSPAIVDEARQLLTRPRTTFETANAEKLPWANDAFDAAMANHVLYHLSDRPKGISELARVLKPGGWLFASTVSAHSLQEGRDLAHAFNRLGRGTLEPWPVVAFSLENGAQQLAPHFDAIATHIFDDRLVVTEAEALAAYLTSRGGVSTETRTAFTQFVDQKLSRDGAITISIRSGTFVARRRAA